MPFGLFKKHHNLSKNCLDFNEQLFGKNKDTFNFQHLITLASLDIYCESFVVIIRTELCISKRKLKTGKERVRVESSVASLVDYLKFLATNLFTNVDLIDC